MKTYKLLKEYITSSQFDEVEKFADRLFNKLNIDVVFTKHFKERVNDARNGKDISTAELVGIFKKVIQQRKDDIEDLKLNDERVLKDLTTNLNLPFVLQWDSKNKEIDFVSKTIMRKKDFKTSNKKIEVK